MATPANANQFIESQIDQLAAALENCTDSDVLSYVGPMLYGTDDLIRDVVDGRGKKRRRLSVVLETTGGFIEPVRRIVEVFRYNYESVEFIIPSYAMSAGTVLAMSGDAIHMDYYSTLGPIDPQVEGKDGAMVPALGYIVQYNRLLKKARANKASSAEIAILLKFDQAELYMYEQDRELSITFLKEWLVQYKFKDWTKTETTNKIVTQKMKEDRAKSIASQLNDTDRWHTHGRGITMDVLRKQLNLIIDDFGQDATLNEHIRSYHRLLVDYMKRMGKSTIVHRPSKLIFSGT